VDAHGGAVAVDSAPGRGARFSVHLPSPAGPGPIPAPQPAVTPRPLPVTPSGGDPG
jgi:hypothetical protein